MKKQKLFGVLITALLAVTLAMTAVLLSACGGEEDKKPDDNKPVIVVTLSKIAVTTNPTKTAYAVGETFDPSGIAVLATYSDNSTKEITSGLVYSLTGPLTEEDTSVDVSYTEKGVTKSTSLAITVTDPRESYEFMYTKGTYTGCSPAVDCEALSTMKKAGATITFTVNMPEAGTVSLYWMGSIPINLGYTFDQIWTLDIDGEWMEETAEVLYASPNPGWLNFDKLYLGDVDFAAGDHTVKFTVTDFQDGGMANFQGVMFKSDVPVNSAKTQNTFGRDDAVLSGGASAESANEAVGGLYKKSDAKISYSLNVAGTAGETVKADLYVTTAIADNDTSFGEVLTVSVNGAAVNTDSVVWHTEAAPGWATFEKLYIGQVTLDAGHVNTVVIGVPAEGDIDPDNDHRGQTCFMSVTLATDGIAVTSAKTAETTFACTDAVLSGGAELQGDALDYVGGLYKVSDAKISYGINVSGAAGSTVEAELYVTTGIGDNAASFADVLTVTVNGAAVDVADAAWNSPAPGWQAFEKILIGRITLNVGAANTIVIGVPAEGDIDPDNDHRGQTCFKSITLAAEGVEFTKAA